MIDAPLLSEKPTLGALGNTSYIGTIGAIIMAGFVAPRVAMWWRCRGSAHPK
jgi:hypothetical protein